MRQEKVVDDEFFERRIHSAFGRANLPVSPEILRSGKSPTLQIVHDAPKFFRQCRSTAPQKKLFDIRYSLFANRSQLTAGFERVILFMAKEVT